MHIFDRFHGSYFTRHMLKIEQEKKHTLNWEGFPTAGYNNA